MTRWATHEFRANETSGLCTTCNDRYARVWHTVPTGWARTGEGQITKVPDQHQYSGCDGQRAEKGLYFEGAWHWFCMSCGAIWRWTVEHSPLRYLRSL